MFDYDFEESRSKIYQRSDLLAILGDYPDDFDIEGIEDECTYVSRDGKTYWRSFCDDVDVFCSILQRFDFFSNSVFYATPDIDFYPFSYGYIVRGCNAGRLFEGFYWVADYRTALRFAKRFLSRCYRFVYISRIEPDDCKTSLVITFDNGE